MNILKDIFERCDIILLQEIRLYLFQQNIIKDLLIDSNCQTVSNIKENDYDGMGYPYGGCPIISKKSIPM